VEIPEEDGIAEGWYTKVVTIAWYPQSAVKGPTFNLSTSACSSTWNLLDWNISKCSLHKGLISTNIDWQS
jgi:hypothetical protein